jgi:hypothetical protein
MDINIGANIIMKITFEQFIDIDRYLKKKKFKYLTLDNSDNNFRYELDGILIKIDIFRGIVQCIIDSDTLLETYDLSFNNIEYSINQTLSKQIDQKINNILS